MKKEELEIVIKFCINQMIPFKVVDGEVIVTR